MASQHLLLWSILGQRPRASVRFPSLFYLPRIEWVESTAPRPRVSACSAVGVFVCTAVFPDGRLFIVPSDPLKTHRSRMLEEDSTSRVYFLKTMHAAGDFFPGLPDSHFHFSRSPGTSWTLLCEAPLLGPLLFCYTLPRSGCNASF